MVDLKECYFLCSEIFPERVYKRDKTKLTKKGEKIHIMLGIDNINNTCKTFKSKKPKNYESNRGMTELRRENRRNSRKSRGAIGGTWHD